MILRLDTHFNTELVTQSNDSWLAWARSHVVPKDIEVDTEETKELKLSQVILSYDEGSHGVTSVEDLQRKSEGNDFLHPLFRDIVLLMFP